MPCGQRDKKPAEEKRCFMTISIRRADVGDIPDIHRLLNEVNLVHHNIRPDLFNVGRKYTDGDLQKILQDDTKPVFAAVDSETGTFLGYCMTQVQQILGDTIRTEIRTLYIDDLCVEEKARGQHVGQAMYAYVKNYATENGFYNLTLHVWAGNDGAAAFYAKMGLKPQYICLEQIL